MDTSYRTEKFPSNNIVPLRSRMSRPVSRMMDKVTPLIPRRPVSSPAILRMPVPGANPTSPRANFPKPLLSAFHQKTEQPVAHVSAVVLPPTEKKTAPLRLSSLKNGFGHKIPIDKSASPQNLKGLREALASALHKDIDTLKEKEKNAPEARKEAEPSAPKTSISSEIKQPLPDAISKKKEVPEDVLKKILHADAE